MTAAVGRGRALFAAGHYFAAHDAWEDGWRAAAPGPARTALQALVQLAAAFHHAARGRRAGVPRLLAAALVRLGPLPRGTAGLDLDPLRAAIARLIAQARAPDAGLPLAPPPLGAAPLAPQPRPGGSGPPRSGGRSSGGSSGSAASSATGGPERATAHRNAQT